MNYKKLIKNQELRFKILGLLDFVPDSLMIRLQYWIKTGRLINLNNPQRFTEKLQWYKLFYRNPLMTQCADKYQVREYIEKKGLSDILVKLYGVYNHAKEIDFNSLPDKFVLKTNNGSHTIIICKDKSKLDIPETIKTLKKWMESRPVKLGREWAYYNIKPLIICEEYLEGDDDNFEGVSDYKFICFNGEAKYVWIDVNRYVDHRRNFYDVNWNFLDISSDCANYGDTIKKPKGLDEMIKVVNHLSRDFPHVRVDIYWVNGRVYFGELTFYLLSGYESFKPDEFDFILGNYFELPQKNKLLSNS